MNDVVDFSTGGDSVSGDSNTINDQFKTLILQRKKAAAPRLDLRHDKVPEVMVTCRLPLDGEEMSEVSARANKRGNANGSSATWFNRLIIARTCESITVFGEKLVDTKGNPLTFASPEYLELVGASDAGTAVFVTYGSDAYISAVSSKLVSAAGFGDDSEVDATDPFLTNS